ncbi:MAG: KH domain-containing protein [Lentisphaerae bacterium]|nr:KH domain-containing protein [Lentisphaerota bacterium]
MAEINSEELASKARKTLGTMLDYLGLNAELKAEVSENQLSLKIKSTEPGRIIGRKGQTLDNLQLLLNRIMFKGDEDCPRISIDIDGYSENGNRSERPRRERSERSDRGDRSERSERRPRHDRRSGISEDQLIGQAKDAAKEVKKWGEPVTLPKMNAHDRRIIHITLENDPEIMTVSEGEGALKKVVVSLRKENEATPKSAEVQE